MKEIFLTIIVFMVVIACSSCASVEPGPEPPEPEPELHEIPESPEIIENVESLVSEAELGFANSNAEESDDEATVTDGVRFATEYMEHNGQLRGNGEPHLFLDIPSDNPVIYLQADEVINKLESGTGIINLGFPICPWCREIVPHLIKLAEQENVPLYYMNIQPIRDVMELDESGEIITTTEGTPEYLRMVEILYDWLWEYAGLNDPEIKRIYVPTTIFVRDGEILYVHIATLRENYEDGYTPLDDQQLERVTGYLTDAMMQILTGENNADDDCGDCP